MKTAPPEIATVRANLITWLRILVSRDSICCWGKLSERGLFGDVSRGRPDIVSDSFIWTPISQLISHVIGDSLTMLSLRQYV